MAERTNEERDDESFVARRAGAAFASAVALARLRLLVARRSRCCGSSGGRSPPNICKSEFERRGVQATYHLDRVGLRTQQVSNLVIGDPRRPDLTARFAQIQMRVKWNGSFEVYRIVARGVRLRGRMVNGKVSWGQIDKLLPPPSGKPFQLPNFVLDVADSQHLARRRRSGRSASRSRATAN